MELNTLHGAAFGHTPHDDDWERLLATRSLGWVSARQDTELVGFVNVLWDGLVHAWLQDVVVSPAWQRRGLGTALVSAAEAGARDAGCEWLHVDFEDHLEEFYLGACGFEPTKAGLKHLGSH